MTMDNYTFDGGRIQKMEVDYTSACDEKIPQAKKLAQNGPEDFRQAIDTLLTLEKQTRLGADMSSCSRVLVAICQICFENSNWVALNENIAVLVKRRSQLKQAVSKMVQECYNYIQKTPDKATKMKLIDTLRTVTEGKIYVEVERARLTKILADIKEEDGDIAGAATIMEELQVETYGTMERREKVELILEQMRLCLLKQDFVRTQIIAKKISIKFFDDPLQYDLKYKFYELMIQLDKESSFLKTSRHYQALVEEKEFKKPEEDKTSAADSKSDAKSATEGKEVKVNAAKKSSSEEGGSDSLKMDIEEESLSSNDDKKSNMDMEVETVEGESAKDELKPSKIVTPEERREKMVYAVLYCILAPYDNEQCDMMENLSKKKIIEEIPVFKEILRLFMCKELINFEIFNNEFGEHLKLCTIFDASTKHGTKCWEELRNRLIEHNIRIIAAYYTRIHLNRMEELLNLPANKCEEYLSKLANAGTIRVKIDRPLGVVYFTSKKIPSDVLNEWAHDINQLMSLVNKTCHLINKEECINKVATEAK